MSQQERWQAHPSDSRTPADVSSTFVKPLHAGSSQSFSPYTRSADTAIPPPPPYLYPQLPSRPRRNRGYLIALAVFTLCTVVLGSLEVVQLAAHTLFSTYPYGSVGSNQAGISLTQHSTVSLKTTPVSTLTPGTIKENITLTCGGCNDPVHITVNSIAVDTTNLRTVWKVILNNESGALQIDYFAEFSLQDPLGNTYEGTGNLNSDFFLRAGQIVFKTEIFSFLPQPGISYTLVAHLGISGIAYEPLQFTF